MSTSELQSQAIIGNGFAICGLAPRRRLARIHYLHCDHCKRRRRHVRLFSGSGWYEDTYLCLTCGEDWGTGYHPFERGWRKRSTAAAHRYLEYVIPAAEFSRLVWDVVAEEMGDPA